MLCFLRGWNTQLEVWRLIGSEHLGGFALVRVSDQAIYNRIERAAIPLQWLFEQVSVWLRARLVPWEDRRLAPWATAVYAADASTLDHLSRFLPLEYAVRFGRDLGLIRPSTRYHIEVPWIDPSWLVPPPPEAVQPREMVRYRSQTKGTGPKRVGIVRLKAGKLYLLE
jgi:hypothetical protein